MSFIFNGTEITDVIYKDAANPNGIALTHLALESNQKVVSGTAYVTWQVAQRSAISADGSTLPIFTFSSGVKSVSAPDGYVITKVTNLEVLTKGLDLGKAPLRITPTGTISEDGKTLTIELSASSALATGNGSAEVAYTISCISKYESITHTGGSVQIPFTTGNQQGNTYSMLNWTPATITAPDDYFISSITIEKITSSNSSQSLSGVTAPVTIADDKKSATISLAGTIQAGGACNAIMTVSYAIKYTYYIPGEISTNVVWHKNQVHTVVDPTCTAEGYTDHTCADCGENYIDNYVDKLAHIASDWTYNPEPTETKWGIRTNTCTTCGELLTLEYVYPTTAVNKSYFNLVLDRDSNYTVSAADVANMPSVVCLPMTDGDTPVTGTTVTHVYERGFGYCKSLEELYIPANYTYINDSAFYGCSNLRKVVFDNDCKISSIGRSAFDECTSLEVCSLPSTINYIGSNAFANTANLIIYCEAASKPAGWADDWVDDTVTVIWGCGCAYNEHDFDQAVTLPTCTAQGYTTYTCSKCGATYTHNYTAALGHISTSYPTVAATCTTSGFKGGTYCSVCNAELTPRTAVAPLGHNWGLPIYTWASDYLSCTATRKCVNDITHEETQTTKAITESVTKQPTCTTNGTRRYVAVFTAAAGLDNWADEAIKTVSIPATGLHTAGDWEITAEPTLISTGTRVKKCTGCGAVMEEETIPKLDLKVPTIAATVERGKTQGNLTWDEITVTLTNPNSMALDYTINYSFTSGVSSSVAANNSSGTIAANSSVTHTVVPMEPDLQYGGNKDTTFGNCRIYAFFDDYPSISATKNVAGSTPEIEDTSATVETPEVGTYNLLASNALTVEGWEFVDSGNITNEGYTKSEVFYAGGYLENNSGTVVPVLYKLFDSDSTDPDMDEPFFHVGQGTVDGVTCDKWRKIEADGQFTWTSTCKQYVYTNVIVSNNRFIDSIFGTSSETYPLTITINSTAYADPGSGVTTVGRVAYISETTATEISTGETLTYGVTAVHTKYGRLKLSATGTNCNYSFVCIDESSGTYALTISNPTDAVTITINGTS